MSAENNERQSLLDLFCSPDEKRIGVFGLLCALSADEKFAEGILERFSGWQGKTQRMHLGHCYMALFLDPHNGPIPSLPGLYQAYPEERKWEGKTKLQHAKVALLGFGEPAKGQPDYYRLIVFTGNWTSEAVNSSINLVWYCDYDCTSSSENQKQEASDICEAVEFWRVLLGKDGSGGYYSIAKNLNLRNRITKFLNEISEKANPPKRGYPPRFVSNLLDVKAKGNEIFVDNSMGAQFIKFVVENGTRHNFICCGSGFFEQADKKDLPKEPEEPEVVKGIVDVLKGKDRLAKNVDYVDEDGNRISKWLVINPATSGAAGEWIKNTPDSDLTWSLCPPKHPDKEDASFHAKYIFTANKRNDSYSNGLLYIGSGNLSKQGFALGPGTNGNIEAGVFFAVNDSIKDKDLCKKLGIDPDYWLDPDSIEENPDGEESEQKSEIHPSPPITSCVWNSETCLLKLEWDQNQNNPNARWETITINGEAIHNGQEEMQIDVNCFNIRLKAKQEGKPYEWKWDIPVFNEKGDFYSPPMRPKSMPEILDMIRSFPAVYEDEDEEEDGTIEDATEDSQTGNVPNRIIEDFCELRNQYKDSPLHSATALVETIAVQNQQIRLGQMRDWIAHLRQTLIEGMKKETINELQSLGTNFLELLKEKPGFAPVEPTEEYKNFIEEVIDKWGFKNAKLLVEKGVSNGLE